MTLSGEGVTVFTSPYLSAGAPAPSEAKGLMIIQMEILKDKWTDFMHWIPFIARSCVLQTIDGGVKVLKTIFGEVRQSTASWEGACFCAYAYTSIGAAVD